MFGKRMTFILAWGARQSRLGRNRSNSGKDDCSRQSQCMESQKLSASLGTARNGNRDL